MALSTLKGGALELIVAYSIEYKETTFLKKKPQWLVRSVGLAWSSVTKGRRS